MFATPYRWVPVAPAMTNLKSLRIKCPRDADIRKILECIHVPQFESLDTVQLSLPSPSVLAIATDGSGHTLQFSQADGGFHPLRQLGGDITTLRLDIGTCRPYLHARPSFRRFLLSIGSVEVLELCGALTNCIGGILYDHLTITRILPRLKVIRVALTMTTRGLFRFSQLFRICVWRSGTGSQR